MCGGEPCRHERTDPIAPPLSERLCPDCEQGKHGNCTGEAWDNTTDAPAVCPCPHPHHRVQDAFNRRAL